jgi:transposase
MEQGPQAAYIARAIEDLVDEIVAADPARNALIARAEDASDERDARRLGTLDLAGALHPVFVPDLQHETLRSLLRHDLAILRSSTMTKNRLKALLRRHAVPVEGKGVYRRAGREGIRRRLPNADLRWQLDSLWRQLDQLRIDRVGVRRQIGRAARKLPTVKPLKTIPGVGGLVAATLVATIVDPARFGSQAKISSYGGLGLAQGFTAWQQVGRTRASKRGNRMLKRVLFLAARAATRSRSALGARYHARIAMGWDDKKAIRDIARKIEFIACAIMRTGRDYDDNMVNIPGTAR